MNFLPNLRRQHDDLVGLAEEIAENARSKTSFRDEGFGKTLSLLEGKLKIHLSMEDSHLYPLLSVREDGDIGGRVSEYQKEMIGLCDLFHAFTMKVKEEGREDLDDGKLHRELDGIVEKLLRRIDFEERVLFPLLEDGELG